MRILAVDTTSKFLSLGIYDKGKLCEYNIEAGRRMSSLIVPTIKRALSALNLPIEKIDYFAAACGPGSFTGIRIGVSVVKGLSWSLGKPVAGISSLDILAQGALDKGGVIVPAVDAKRNLIYCAIFRRRKNSLIRSSPYMLIKIEELLKKLPSGSVILGDGIALYQNKILSKGGVVLLDKDYWYPKGHNIIAIAIERIKKKRITASAKLKPVYLYPKECQIR